MALRLFTSATSTAKDKSVKNVNKNRSDAELTSIFKDKSVLIIGGTKGIGAAIAMKFAVHGASVEIVGRSQQEGDALVAEMQKANPSGKFAFHKVDCAKAKECHEFANSFKSSHESLDYLINTVGIFAGKERKTSADGLELDFALSYFSRFVILSVLAPWLNSFTGKRPTVCNVATSGVSFPKVNWADVQTEKSYTPFKAHTGPVSANDMMIIKGSKLFPNIDFLGFNPGFVRTGLMSDSMSDTASKMMGARLPENYVNNIFIQIVATAAMELKGSGLKLFDPYCTGRVPSNFAGNPENYEKLWEYSNNLLEGILKK